MRKIMTLFVSLCLLLTLVACGSNASNTGNSGEINNDERGQSFLSANIPMFSEYLNSSEPIVGYMLQQVIAPDTLVTGLCIIQNDTLTLASLAQGDMECTVTLSDLSAMSDEEVIAFANQYSPVTVPYLLSVDVDVAHGNMTGEYVWFYNHLGEFDHWLLRVGETMNGEVGGHHYYGYSSARIAFRCESDEPLFRLDEPGTPGVVSDVPSGRIFDHMEALMNEIYQPPAPSYD